MILNQEKKNRQSLLYIICDQLNSEMINIVMV